MTKRKKIHESQVVDIRYMAVKSVIALLKEYPEDSYLDIELEHEPYEGESIQCSISWQRDETDEERNVRLDKEREKKAREKKQKEERERKQYERLRKKFEK